MGNTGSTISAKNWDASRMPTVQNSAGAALAAEHAVIFNVGIADVRCFPATSIVSLSLLRYYTLTEKKVLQIQADLAERKTTSE